MNEPGNLPGALRMRLEDEGPLGSIERQTSNRAELRAVVAALQHMCAALQDRRVHGRPTSLYATEINSQGENMHFSYDIILQDLIYL